METYLILGLGNPGREYQDNRHNVGFKFLDFFKSTIGKNIPYKFEKRFNAEISIVEYNNKKFILAKPQTFMNLSGNCAYSIANFYKLQSERIVVVYDEIDLSFGQVKLKFAGGNAGHNGIKSIESILNSKDFYRIRLGIGKPSVQEYEISSWVLGNFSKDEQKSLEIIFEKTKDAILTFVEYGLETAQKDFNKNFLDKP